MTSVLLSALVVDGYVTDRVFLHSYRQTFSIVSKRYFLLSFRDTARGRRI